MPSNDKQKNSCNPLCWYHNFQLLTPLGRSI
jgi:hypothetical protein